MIHLYSGDGKGKTSIANGMACRMAGVGNKVLYARFMKGTESSELKAFSNIAQIKVLEADRSFPFYNQMTDADKVEITKCHNKILRKIIVEVEKILAREEKKSETEDVIDCDIMSTTPELLIVLDEITYPCRWNLVDISLLESLIDKLPPCVELVMTGRDPLDFMIESADYWSEVTMKKHPFEKGVVARVGVEM